MADFPLFSVSYQFIHVVAASEKLFPVADATTFFTDLHRILRVIAAGNARTVCHRRLVLLEQVMVSYHVDR